ncbi:MAG: M15 family metallopeptidase [Ruminococcus sp.]|nr:M15 family metallopeptidase [Ruminococcus sp.]
MDRLIIVSALEPAPEKALRGIRLVTVRGKRFEAHTGAALRKLLRAAQAEGINLSVISGYRSKGYQKKLWAQERERLAEQGIFGIEADKLIGRTLALPGCSEHNLGIAADLGREGALDTEEDLFRSGEFSWLWENAHRFGFILRYPRMKEHITGISFEPWHFRYVGAEAAELIRESGLCLEEFVYYYDDRFTILK